MKSRVLRGAALTIVLSIAACSGRGCGSQPGETAGGPAATDEQADSVDLLQPVAAANQDLAVALGVGRGAAATTVEGVAASVEAAAAAAEAAEREMPRESFDIAAVADRVGRDPVKLFEWVRDNTRLVPYRGVLRGSRGVLMDRLGNSLDRSLALAELLGASGFDVRLARATLESERANELLKSVQPLPAGRSDAPAGEPQANEKDAIADYASAKGLDAGRLREAIERMSAAAEEAGRRFQQRVETQATQIAGLVGTTANGDAATDDVESLRDHWWVQYKTADGWIDLDPGAIDSVPGQAAGTASETLAATDIPADLYHRVTIRVVVEQMGSTALHQATVLEHAIRVHESNGQRIVLRHRALKWPASLDPGNAQFRAQLDDLVRAQREWVPVLKVGAESISQSSFTDAGTVNATPSAPSVHEPASMDGGKFVDAFGGGGPAEEAPASGDLLTAEWIEFEIAVPGRAVRKIRRDVFDVLGPAARRPAANIELRFDDKARLRRNMALLGETEILVLGGQLSEPYVEHLFNTSLLQQRGTLAEIFRAGAGNDMARVIELSGGLDPVPVQLYGFALAREALSPVKGDVYIDSPNVFGFHRRLGPAGDDQLVRIDSFDVIANDVAARRGGDPVRARLTQGVVDTAAESLFVSGCRECKPADNVSNLWLTSRDAGVEWQPVRNVQELAGGDFGLSDDARYRVEQELAAGYAVLLPEQAAGAEGKDPVGWWRVHPRTGATLGMMESGEGQAIVEYLRQKQAIVGAGFFVFTLYDCVGDSGRGGFVKVAACVGCSAAAGEGSASTLRSVGRVTLTSVTPGFAVKAIGIAAICLAASIM